jgi:hypothetical protein
MPYFESDTLSPTTEFSEAAKGWDLELSKPIKTIINLEKVRIEDEKAKKYIPYLKNWLETKKITKDPINIKAYKIDYNKDGKFDILMESNGYDVGEGEYRFGLKPNYYNCIILLERISDNKYKPIEIAGNYFPDGGDPFM